jgi:hypothetical protein
VEGISSILRSTEREWSPQWGAMTIEVAGRYIIRAGVRNARKTIQWIVFSGERGEEPMTSSGGHLIGSEVNRNKWSPQCGATPIEVADIPYYVRRTHLIQRMAEPSLRHSSFFSLKF